VQVDASELIARQAVAFLLIATLLAELEQVPFVEPVVVVAQVLLESHELLPPIQLFPRLLPFLIFELLVLDDGLELVFEFVLDGVLVVLRLLHPHERRVVLSQRLKRPALPFDLVLRILEQRSIVGSFVLHLAETLHEAAGGRLPLHP